MATRTRRGLPLAAGSARRGPPRTKGRAPPRRRLLWLPRRAHARALLPRPVPGVSWPWRFMTMPCREQWDHTLVLAAPAAVGRRLNCLLCIALSHPTMPQGRGGRQHHDGPRGGASRRGAGGAPAARVRDRQVSGDLECFPKEFGCLPAAPVACMVNSFCWCSVQATIELLAARLQVG